MTRTAAEHDFLAIGNKCEAEDHVGDMQPTVRFRVAPEYRCRQCRIKGAPDPTTYIMVKEDDADNPAGGFQIRRSESLPLEGDNSAGWNSGQDCQTPDASSVIPKDPCCWIRLFQSYDL